jgi:hypothetical protein
LFENTGTVFRIFLKFGNQVADQLNLGYQIFQNNLTLLHLIGIHEALLQPQNILLNLTTQRRHNFPNESFQIPLLGRILNGHKDQIHKTLLLEIQQTIGDVILDLVFQVEHENGADGLRDQVLLDLHSLVLLDHENQLLDQFDQVSWRQGGGTARF